MPGKYILHSMRATEEALRANATGTTFEAIRGDDLRSHPLPLPPLAEQHRIVAEIEKQLTRLDAAIVALKRVQANLKRYRASVLKTACEGSWSLPRRSLPGPKAARTNPLANSWTASWTNVAQVGSPRRNAEASTKSLSDRTRLTCRNCRRAGCGRRLRSLPRYKEGYKSSQNALLPTTRFLFSGLLTCCVAVSTWRRYTKSSCSPVNSTSSDCSLGFADC